MTSRLLNMLKRHPYRVRWDGLSHGIFHRSGFRLHSNAAIAADTMRVYIDEALRHNRPAAALIEYWDGQRWQTVDGYGDGFAL